VDVAEADRRLVRLDANGGDVSSVGGSNRFANGPHKASVVFDDVIGREGADDDIRLPLHEDCRREADGRARVLRLTLEHDVEIGKLGQIFLDGGTVCAPGDDHNALLTAYRSEAVPGVPQQGIARTGEVVEELGCISP